MGNFPAINRFRGLNGTSPDINPYMVYRGGPTRHSTPFIIELPKSLKLACAIFRLFDNSKYSNPQMCRINKQPLTANSAQNPIFFVISQLEVQIYLQWGGGGIVLGVYSLKRVAKRSGH